MSRETHARNCEGLGVRFPQATRLSLQVGLFYSTHRQFRSRYTKRYQHMRCPKCGYISFDHLEKCLKCNKDIKATAVSLFGTTYNIQVPTFLKLPPLQQEESSEENDLFQERSVDEIDEYVDDELEILVEDEDADLDGEIRFAQDEDIGLVAAGKREEEDEGEIGIDFSQFDDADEPEANLLDEDMEEEGLAEPIAKVAPAMEIPAELSDMSDLAPPGKAAETARRPAEKTANADLSDLELEDLYFDLGLDGVDEEQKNKKARAKEAVLALDEIDFSDALGESGSGSSKKLGNMDMDEDLDFDLDLGGLSIHKDV
jgi:hypothetical protein